MTAKIKELYQKYRELIVYIFFGGLTTVVSWGSYFLFKDMLNIHYQWAQWISWVAAVAFAFVVNKLFVFNDKDMTANGIFRQIWKFVSVRIASGVIESLFLGFLVEIISMGEGISKIIVSVLTVIINYIASKLFIFKKKEQ